VCGDVVVVLVFYYASALVCVVLAVSLSLFSLILSHLYVPINGSSRQLNNNAPNSGRVPSTQSNPVWCAFFVVVVVVVVAAFGEAGAYSDCVDCPFIGWQGWGKLTLTRNRERERERERENTKRGYIYIYIHRIKCFT
jgi:hypothetical protein